MCCDAFGWCKGPAGWLIGQDYVLTASSLDTPLSNPYILISALRHPCSESTFT